MIDLVELNALVEQAERDNDFADVLRDKAFLLARQVLALSDEVERCHARLEITHCWKMEAGDKVRVEIPPAERATFPDGIECRNETIRLRDENNAKLRAALTAAESEAQALRERMGEINSTVRLTAKSDKTHCILALDRIAALSTTPKEKEGC